jgi:hypothetical protein
LFKGHAVVSGVPAGKVQHFFGDHHVRHFGVLPTMFMNAIDGRHVRGTPRAGSRIELGDEFNGHGNPRIELRPMAR